MSDRPSYLKSTTAIAYLIVVAGAMGYAAWTKNTDLILRLVEMIVPSYAGVKGYQMGQKSVNGNGKGEPTPPPPVTP